MQYAALDEALKAHPDVVWWIKGDGCDLVEGLGESKWSRDVDLADGKLQKSYNAYQQKLQFAAQIGLPPRNRRSDELEDLQEVLTLLEQSSEIISTGMTLCVTVSLFNIISCQ